MISAQDLIDIAKYFSVISHTKGRLRVRVSPKIKNLNKEVSLSDIEQLPKKINGIKNIKINKLVGSVTVEYDNTVFSDKLWKDLINGENLDELTELINKLSKEVM